MSLFRQKKPEPFDARAWLERCCERLKDAYNDQVPIYEQLYRKARAEHSMPALLFFRLSRGQRTIDQAVLLRLFRAVKSEFMEDQ